MHVNSDTMIVFHHCNGRWRLTQTSACELLDDSPKTPEILYLILRIRNSTNDFVAAYVGTDGLPRCVVWYDQDWQALVVFRSDAARGASDFRTECQHGWTGQTIETSSAGLRWLYVGSGSARLHIRRAGTYPTSSSSAYTSCTETWMSRRRA